MKKFAVLLYFFLSPTLIFAQVVKGQVFDANTKNSIDKATVKLEGTEISTETDEKGYFSFTDVPLGRQSFVISCIGYSTQKYTQVLVTMGKDVFLSCPMSSISNELNEVIVVSAPDGQVTNQMATISAKSITIEQTKNYAATWGDPARMALSFAGTSNVNDETNEIVIRGNSPKGILWKIEGIEVPNPSHFSKEGATGGGLMALSTNVLSNSAFYTGAFPAEYGNATSGVFDIRLRNGNKERRETTLQAGFTGLELGTEGPFSKKKNSSYLINYRYSSLKLMDQTGLFSVNWNGAVPNFQDLTFKLNFPQKSSNLSIWGTGGLSIFDYSAKASSFPEEVFDKANFYATGLNYLYRLNQKSYIENILSFSGSFKENGYQRDKYYSNYQFFNYSAFRYSSQYNLNINPKNDVKLGVIYSNLGFNILNTTSLFLEDSTITTDRLDQKGQSGYFQGFFQWKVLIGKKLQVNAGMHTSFFLLNNSNTIEPRLGLSYKAGPKSTINAGGGLFSKIEPLSIYYYNKSRSPAGDDVYPNRDLAIPRSSQIVLGYEFKPHRKWRFGIETYYQKLSRFGVPNAINNSTINPNYSLINEMDADIQFANTQTLVSTGKGRNYGIELSIDRFLNNGVYFMSTTSSNRSFFSTTRGEFFQSRFSNGFVQNLLAGKEWRVGKGQKNTLGINTKFSYSAGIRVVPIDMDKSLIAGSEVKDYSKIYDQQQLRNFVRWDFKINYVVNGSRSTSTFSLDMNNITNSQNPLGIYFDSQSKKIETMTQLGFIPIFNYRLEF